MYNVLNTQCVNANDKPNLMDMQNLFNLLLSRIKVQNISSEYYIFV